MQLDHDDFEEIISNSIEELSQDLEMSTLGANVNLLLHVLNDLSEKDPYTTAGLLQKYHELLTGDLDPEQWMQAVLHAMNQWQLVENARTGKISIN